MLPPSRELLQLVPGVPSAAKAESTLLTSKSLSASEATKSVSCEVLFVQWKTI
jgi:hypothetical protein